VENHSSAMSSQEACFGVWVTVNPKTGGRARQALLEAARAGQDLAQDQARYVRVVEYEVPDRDGDGKGEVIALVTTITEMTAAPAPLLAEALPAVGT
jgi:hypothetical protein